MVTSASSLWRRVGSFRCLGLIYSFLALAGMGSPASFGASPPPGPGLHFHRVLFLGNSITRRGASAKLGWPGNWGMAATAEDKDYVHLVVAALGQAQAETPQFLVKNVVDFERGYGTYDVAATLKAELDFKADLIVVALGENVPKFASDADQALFQSSLLKLLRIFQANSQPALVVRSCFWPNPPKDRVLKADCEAVAGTFVDISGLRSDPSNSALSEGHFKDPGVASHPGDKGMAAIAQAIMKGIEQVQTRPAEGRPPPT